MSDFRFLSTHRTWEDWCGMLLGVLIALSPWFPTQTSHELVDAERSFAILNTFTIGIGLWLIASPYIFGYSGDGLLTFWHTSLGGLVVLLAALQLWQDWDLNDQDMLEHGQ